MLEHRIFRNTLHHHIHCQSSKVTAETFEKLSPYSFKSNHGWELFCHGKTSLLNCMPHMLKTCSLANMSCVLTCSRALCAYMLMCLACLRAHVTCMLTCSRANMLCVLTSSSANVPCVLTGNLPCEPMYRKYQQVFFSSFHLSFFVS